MLCASHTSAGLGVPGGCRDHEGPPCHVCQAWLSSQLGLGQSADLGRETGTDLEGEGNSLAGRNESHPTMGTFGKYISRTQSVVLHVNLGACLMFHLMILSFSAGGDPGPECPAGKDTSSSCLFLQCPLAPRGSPDCQPGSISSCALQSWLAVQELERGPVQLAIFVCCLPC